MKTTLRDCGSIHLGNNVRRLREMNGIKQYYENKIQSIEDISRAVLSLAEEVKKLKAAGK